MPRTKPTRPIRDTGRTLDGRPKSAMYAQPYWQELLEPLHRHETRAREKFAKSERGRELAKAREAARPPGPRPVEETHPDSKAAQANRERAGQGNRAIRRLAARRVRRAGLDVVELPVGPKGSVLPVDQRHRASSLSHRKKAPASLRTHMRLDVVREDGSTAISARLSTDDFQKVVERYRVGA